MAAGNRIFNRRTMPVCVIAAEAVLAGHAIANGEYFGATVALAMAGLLSVYLTWTEAKIRFQEALHAHMKEDQKFREMMQ